MEGASVWPESRTPPEYVTTHQANATDASSAPTRRDRSAVGRAAGPIR